MSCFTRKIIVADGRRAVTFFVSAALLTACSLEEPKARAVRGHLTISGGVSHGGAAAHAERYCQGCHGATLGGGARGEPSCYQCHGRTWREVGGGDVRFAPGTHTEQKGDVWLHHPDFANASGICAACHGADLNGSAVQGTPGCFLCHAQLW